MQEAVRALKKQREQLLIRFEMKSSLLVLNGCQFPVGKILSRYLNLEKSFFKVIDIVLALPQVNWWVQWEHVNIVVTSRFCVCRHYLKTFQTQSLFKYRKVISSFNYSLKINAILKDNGKKFNFTLSKRTTNLRCTQCSCNIKIWPSWIGLQFPCSWPMSPWFNYAFYFCFKAVK